jgi:hypothetical protein
VPASGSKTLCSQELPSGLCPGTLLRVAGPNEPILGRTEVADAFSGKGVVGRQWGLEPPMLKQDWYSACYLQKAMDVFMLMC